MTTKKKFIMIVVVPTDNPDMVEVVYGTLDIGEVPNPALIKKSKTKSHNNHP